MLVFEKADASAGQNRNSRRTESGSAHGESSYKSIIEVLE